MRRPQHVEADRDRRVRARIRERGLVLDHPVEPARPREVVLQKSAPCQQSSSIDDAEEMRARHARQAPRNDEQRDCERREHVRVARPRQPPGDQRAVTDQRTLRQTTRRGRFAVRASRRNPDARKGDERDRGRHAPTAISHAPAREEILLAALGLAQARRHHLQLGQTDDDLARLGALVRTHDLELFELLHQTHGARMADRELRLQLRGRRVVGLDDELRRLVAERIDVLARSRRR